MDNAIYANLTRMEGLKSEMQAIANNIANISTAGYKKEGVIFSEWVQALEDANSSLSMARAEIRRVDYSQGPLTQTNEPLNFAIDGDGFFLVDFDGAQALTRAGNFERNANGELVTSAGYRVMDSGGSAITIPADAKQIKLSRDGALSVDNQLVTQIGLFLPAEGDEQQRVGSSLIELTEAPVPVENPTILQGFKEDSNVEAILEVARMIEVHRAYEQGAKLNESEDQRIRAVVKTLGE